MIRLYCECEKRMANFADHSQQIVESHLFDRVQYCLLLSLQKLYFFLRSSQILKHSVGQNKLILTLFASIESNVAITRTSVWCINVQSTTRCTPLVGLSLYCYCFTQFANVLVKISRRLSRRLSCRRWTNRSYATNECLSVPYSPSWLKLVGNNYCVAIGFIFRVLFLWQRANIW
jgi:hypothetical protein